MNEQNAIEEAGAWYVGVLQAVERGLHAAASGMPSDAAARFVASLAQQGWTIERDSVAGEAHTQ